MRLPARLYERAVAVDVTALSAQEGRLAFYLRSNQDEPARRTLGRLEADPRLTYHRMRAIVEGALADCGTDALGKSLQWMQGSLKREPRMAVWAGRLLEARGKVADAIALYTQATETVPAFADAWSARLLAAARLGEAETTTVTNLAGKALSRKVFFSVCAETGAAVRSKVPGWSPPVQTAEDQKAYAQACIAACEGRGRRDAVGLRRCPKLGHTRRQADWAKQTIAALTPPSGLPGKSRCPECPRTADAPATASEMRTRLNASASPCGPPAATTDGPSSGMIRLWPGWSDRRDVERLVQLAQLYASPGIE